MNILAYVIIFWIGLLFGFLIDRWIMRAFKNYGGTIVVNTDELEEKTVYSLILDDYPERLEFQKEVVFRIDSSEKSSDRT